MGCGCQNSNPAPPVGTPGGQIVYIAEGGTMITPETFTEISLARAAATAAGGRVRSMRA